MFYLFARGLFWLFFTCLCRWRVEGAENIPEGGPVVVVANHVGYWDPVALGTALRRPVTFLAKVELFRVPVLGTAITWLGAIPLQRGKGDRAALRTALKVLEQGGVLALFPEGTRSRGGELLPFQRGAALLAAKANAPLVPAALIGTRGLFPGGFRVRFGKPLVASGEGRPVEELNRQAYQSVEELLGL